MSKTAQLNIVCPKCRAPLTATTVNLMRVVLTCKKGHQATFRVGPATVTFAEIKIGTRFRFWPMNMGDSPTLGPVLTKRSAGTYHYGPLRNDEWYYIQETSKRVFVIKR